MTDRPAGTPEPDPTDNEAPGTEDMPAEAAEDDTIVMTDPLVADDDLDDGDGTRATTATTATTAKAKSTRTRPT